MSNTSRFVASAVVVLALASVLAFVASHRKAGPTGAAQEAAAPAASVAAPAPRPAVAVVPAGSGLDAIRRGGGQARFRHQHGDVVERGQIADRAGEIFAGDEGGDFRAFERVLHEVGVDQGLGSVGDAHAGKLPPVRWSRKSLPSRPCGLVATARTLL